MADLDNTYSSMAEENSNIMPDMSDADISIPPIDNIHAPKPEPDFSLSSHEQLTQPLYPMDQINTEMPEAVPAFTPHHPVAPLNTTTSQRTATPTRPVNGAAETAQPMPSKAASHGAPARRYLNEKVTGVLLEGMKRLAADRPDEPLRILGEFLLQKSKELEGTQ